MHSLISILSFCSCCYCTHLNMPGLQWRRRDAEKHNLKWAFIRNNENKVIFSSIIYFFFNNIKLCITVKVVIKKIFTLSFKPVSSVMWKEFISVRIWHEIPQTLRSTCLINVLKMTDLSQLCCCFINCVRNSLSHLWESSTPG